MIGFLNEPTGFSTLKRQAYKEAGINKYSTLRQHTGQFDQSIISSKKDVFLPKNVTLIVPSISNSKFSNGTCILGDLTVVAPKSGSDISWICEWIIIPVLFQKWLKRDKFSIPLYVHANKFWYISSDESRRPAG